MSDWIKELKRNLDSKSVEVKTEQQKLEILLKQSEKWSNDVKEYFREVYRKMEKELDDKVTFSELSHSCKITVDKYYVEVFVNHIASKNTYDLFVQVRGSLPFSNKEIAKIYPKVRDDDSIEFEVTSGLLPLEYGTKMNSLLAEEMVKVVFEKNNVLR